MGFLTTWACAVAITPAQAPTTAKFGKPLLIAAGQRLPSSLVPQGPKDPRLQAVKAGELTARLAPLLPLLASGSMSVLRVFSLRPTGSVPPSITSRPRLIEGRYPLFLRGMLLNEAPYGLSPTPSRFDARLPREPEKAPTI